MQLVLNNKGIRDKAAQLAKVMLEHGGVPSAAHPEAREKISKLMRDPVVSLAAVWQAVGHLVVCKEQRNAKSVDCVHALFMLDRSRWQHCDRCDCACARA